MAILIPPAVEVAAGVGARIVGGIIGAKGADELDKLATARAAAAKKAKESPMAGAVAGSAAKARERCKKCPPDEGVIFERPVAGWSADSINYQLRIGGMGMASPTHINEWLFNGITFDGFVSSACLLKEAKARYDQFFDEFTGIPEEWWSRSPTGEQQMIDEMNRQGIAAKPRPPIKLQWYFMQPMSYRYFSRIFQAMHPDVEVFFEP